MKGCDDVIIAKAAQGKTEGAGKPQAYVNVHA